MKLIRYGVAECEKPGVLVEDSAIDVAAFGEDYDHRFFATDGPARLETWVREHAEACPTIDPAERIGPPIVRPSKIVCVGLNYRKHAEEAGMPMGEEPALFFKASSAIVGPNDDLIIPKGAEKVDWEVELALVIGKKASYVRTAEAMQYVAGYLLHNDCSERTFQLERAGQWMKGKSCDTFAPLGPFLVTPGEIADPHDLALWLKVNDEFMQSGSTSDFIFDLPYVVSYISEFMTLLPGDVISTGTPPGVGLGMEPPKYLRAGDVVEAGIDGLGVSRREVKAYGENLA